MMLRIALAASLLAMGASADGAGRPATIKPEKVAVRLRTDPLVTSQGNKVSLPALIRSSKRTILSFTYSGCSTVCPVSDVIMGQVERLTKGRAPADLRLVTITIDPANDTPRKLARHAAKLGSDPRRLWLTGDYLAVRSVLDGPEWPALDYGRHALAGTEQVSIMQVTAR